MKEIVFYVEVKRDDKWWFIVQYPTLEYAERIASRYLPKGEVRIRRVVRVIVWKNGKRYGKAAKQSCSQAETT